MTTTHCPSCHHIVEIRMFQCDDPAELREGYKCTQCGAVGLRVTSVRAGLTSVTELHSDLVNHLAEPQFRSELLRHGMAKETYTFLAGMANSAMSEELLARLTDTLAPSDEEPELTIYFHDDD